MFMAIWMLCVLLYIYLPLADVSTRSRLAIPIAPAAALVLFLLNPFHVHLYTARRWLVRRLVRIACAPFFFVEFADFWLADQLNSVAVSFGDLEYLVCFYIFDWRDAAPCKFANLLMLTTILSIINPLYAREKKKWRPRGMSVIMFSFLMDFTFDLYVFHFLEWS